ncbi:hypothetical protein [Synechococcus sp. PCC 7502]|nr:hypothetical protein [Synechococcus sp. PCC 7502]
MITTEPKIKTCGNCPNARLLGGDRLVCKLLDQVVRTKWDCQL